MFSLRLAFLLSLSTVFVGCASGTFKARQEQREKMAASTGMYCEFISGDMFPDVDVELSMSMARRCDASKNFSITNYKNSSDQSGVIYCCSSVPKRSGAMSKRSSAAPATTTTAPAGKAETTAPTAEGEDVIPE